ncbi:MAG TPA: hypothetical protein DHU96_34975 [Actinobacteria bacterium]|nr:hypothetical protein [Actinomycetota bacterium]
MGRLLVAGPGWRTIAAIAAASGVTLLAAGCGSGGSSPSGGGTPSGGATSAAPPSAAPGTTPVLCQDAAALRASLTKLTHVSVGAGTANEIKADLADAKAKLTSLAADAHGQWQAQTTALTTALGKVQAAVADLGTNPSPSTVAAVVTALGSVTTAASSLLAALSTACPSASP